MVAKKLLRYWFASAARVQRRHEPYSQPTTRRAGGVTARRSVARRRGARARRAVLVVVALVGTGVLAAGCGGGGPVVASVRKSVTAANGPSAGRAGSTGSPYTAALRYINCMRTHGEPNMPEPEINSGGGVHANVNVNISPSSGIDPASPPFAAANNACKHLLPTDGTASQGPTITAADEADYLKAAACMRSTGSPRSPIRALTTTESASTSPRASPELASSRARRDLSEADPSRSALRSTERFVSGRGPRAVSSLEAGRSARPPALQRCRGAAGEPST